MKIFVLLVLSLLVTCGVVIVRGSEDDIDNDDITVLGLGHMGTAAVECLASNTKSSHKKTVHVWNRSLKKLQAVAHLPRVETHDLALQAVQASPLTLVFIDDWEGSSEILQSIVPETKKVVVFSTYTPADIHQINDKHNNNSFLVGGAIVGVPETLCTDQALVLVTDDSLGIDALGRVVALPSEDNGLAALVNLCLILVITFGVAGHELALLILQQYKAGEATVDAYVSLSVDIGAAYMKLLLPSVSKSMISNDFTNSYVPGVVFRRVLQRHLEFMESLGIGETFLTKYVESLGTIQDNSHGPAAWTQAAIVQSDPNIEL